MPMPAPNLIWRATLKFGNKARTTKFETYAQTAS